MKRDELYRSPLSEVEDFVFNEKVADVFEDMARRSIPGYQTIINLIGVIVASHVKEQGVVNNLHPPYPLALSVSLYLEYRRLENVISYFSSKLAILTPKI